jgi:hypothetical protein
MAREFIGFVWGAVIVAALLGTQAARAADDDVGTEAWLRYEYRTKLKDNLRGFFGLRYEEQLASDNLLGDWRRWDLKGGVSYDLTKRLRLEGGIGGYHTWLPDVTDVYEIRLWQALTVDWPEIKAFARYKLHNRFMIEERFKNTTSGMSLRGRYRLSMSIPINRYTVEPGAFYMPLAAEIFANLSSDDDQLFAAQARYTIASSLATRFTAVEIGYASSKSSGAGVSSAAAVSASTPRVSSHASNASSGRITGIRPWMSFSVALASVVTIAAVSTSSPFGPIQLSHNPANANGAPSLTWM